MTITDADREAAGLIYESLLPDDAWRAVSARLGHMDDLPTVQAFARHRIAAEQAGAPKWQPIESAPYNTPVIVEVGSGMSFAAQLVPDASMDSEDQFCDQWRAVHQGEHPPCWSGGACWERNENDAISMQPRRWRVLDPEEICR